jgi:hypothetical protein
VTKLAISELLPGYRSGKSACKPLASHRSRPRHSHACTVTKRIGSLSHADVAGANNVAFSGRLNGRELATGSYALAATPRLGSLTGPTVTARFHVV